jgi:hypothetical protein
VWGQGVKANVARETHGEVDIEDHGKSRHITVKRLDKLAVERTEAHKGKVSDPMLFPSSCATAMSLCMALLKI